MTQVKELSGPHRGIFQASYVKSTMLNEHALRMLLRHLMSPQNVLLFNTDKFTLGQI